MGLFKISPPGFWRAKADISGLNDFIFTILLDLAINGEMQTPLFLDRKEEEWRHQWAM
jgi:hypothetical protein